MNAQPTTWRVLKNDHEVARAATGEIFAAVRAAIGEGHPARIALSGGHTPSLMYRLWADELQAQFPWEQMELYWSDERCVPAGDPLSNFRMVREALLDHLPKPPPYFPMPAAQPDHEAAARQYEATLRSQITPHGPSFDVLLLGIGEEGHTASLFPGSPALAESARWVVPVTAPVKPPFRLTLTLPVLSRAMNVFFLVTGESKRDIVHAIRTEPDAPRRYPAAMVQASVQHWHQHSRIHRAAWCGSSIKLPPDPELDPEPQQPETPSSPFAYIPWRGLAWKKHPETATLESCIYWLSGILRRKASGYPWMAGQAGGNDGSRPSNSSNRAALRGFLHP